LMATLCGFAVPQLVTGLDDLRTAGAVRYLSARLQQTRMEAVLRGSDVALRFVADGTSFRYATYVDGNGDGIRSVDIQRRVDRARGVFTRPVSRHRYRSAARSACGRRFESRPGDGSAETRSQQHGVVQCSWHLVDGQFVRAWQACAVRDPHLRRNGQDPDPAV